MAAAASDHEQKRLKLEEALQDDRVELVNLPTSLLEEMTDVSQDVELVGEGGNGIVYKATLRNGLVAVKKIKDVVVVDEKKSEDVVKRFCREFFCMMESKHENIVRFLGYSFALQEDGKSVDRQMYICSEYMPNGSLHEYIKDESCRFQWSTRYRIIRGILDGLHHLHTTGTPIIHKDLTPSNVLLDHNMVPKITDFGTSRRFDRGQSQSFTHGKAGLTWGYASYELAMNGIFTAKSDMYSLGIIIMDLLVGYKKREEFVADLTPGGDIVDTVLGTWKKVLAQEQVQVLQQVQVCAEMAVKCMDQDPTQRTDKSSGQDDHTERGRRPAEDRPAASDIIHRLGQMENSTWSALGQINARSTGAELLDIRPRVLCFPLRNKMECSYLWETSCLVHLTNNTDQSVGFWIVPHFPKLYQVSSCCGEVQPSETHVVNIVLIEGRRPPIDTGVLNILTVARSEKNTNDFMSAIRESVIGELHGADLVKRINKLGEVHQAALTAVIRPSRKPKVIRSNKIDSVHSSIDVHPTEPWK